MLRHPKYVAWLVLLVALAGCHGPSRYDDADSNDGDSISIAPAVEGEILVKYKTGTRSAALQAALEAIGAQMVRRFHRTGVTQIRVSGDTRSAIAELSANPDVLYAEPNYIVHALETIPDEPWFYTLWGLNNAGQTGGTEDADIDAVEAWDVQTGNSDVIVGIVDSGIDLDHADLVDNLYVNEVEANGTPGVDDDENGYIDDIHGINAITGTGDPSDDDGHGTHVAGTIGATGNNGVGVVGVAWDVQIAACKFLDRDGYGDTADAIECLEYFTALGARAVNNSWGGGGTSQAMKDAISAAGEAGTLFIAAAGNGGFDGIGDDNDVLPHYPSNYSNTNIIAVAATDHRDRVAGFSNFGINSVDVAAPGVKIKSTWNGGGYLDSEGTSMAAPQVTGLAALLWSQFPDATHEEIKARIMLTVDYLEYPIASGGRINAHRALTWDLSAPVVVSLFPKAGGPGDAITVSGLNFGEERGAGTVRLTDAESAESACDVVSWSDDEIVCTIPVVEDGSYEVTVIADGDKASDPVTFTVLAPFYELAMADPLFLGGGDPQHWQALDRCWSYVLPFTFNYFGTDYESVYVCSKGYMDFASDVVDYTNTDEDLIARTMVAPLWNDMGTSEGGDIYVHQPSATSVAIRWEGNVYNHPDRDINVEVVLDSTGTIRFNYGPGNSEITPTVGISEGNELRHHLAPYSGTSSLTGAASLIYTPRVTVVLPECGNGIVEEDEVCDDGGESPSCNADCTVASCGDGRINESAGEQCDDAGESVSCDDDCTVPVCGDELVNTSAGEACDDGNDDSVDECVSCVSATCGDGFIQEAVEACDDGADNSDATPDACRTNCMPARCGDGIVDAEEGCDDVGESESCNVDCTPAVCGDGVVNASAGEECDRGDANAESGLECSTTCKPPNRAVCSVKWSSPDHSGQTTTIGLLMLLALMIRRTRR